MWNFQDLGRYTASNYGLLKTVLGINLELFQQQDESVDHQMINQNNYLLISVYLKRLCCSLFAITAKCKHLWVLKVDY